MPRQIPNIIGKTVKSVPRVTIIVATKKTKQIRHDVNLRGFFKSIKQAFGLLIHNGHKNMITLPIIKGVTDNVNKFINPTIKTTTPAANVR